MLVLMLRTLILYTMIVASVRIMGKRQIGELQPSELVVAIMISDLASVPMQSIDIPLMAGVIPVLTLIIAEIFMSFLCLKSRKLRRFFTGEPSIIICNGHVNEKELEKLRFNLNDLSEQLRISGYSNLADIEVAVLETNGQLSVIPKADARCVTVRDLKIRNPRQERLVYMLISDGTLNHEELIRCQKTEEWLKKELQKQKISCYEEVFIASYDPQDGFYIQRKGEQDQQ